jgi:hypothetical protein
MAPNNIHNILGISGINIAAQTLSGVRPGRPAGVLKICPRSTEDRQVMTARKVEAAGDTTNDLIEAPGFQLTYSG